MNDTVEQLKHRLAFRGAEPSTEKVDVLNELALETNFDDPDQKGKFASQALGIARPLS